MSVKLHPSTVILLVLLFSVLIFFVDELPVAAGLVFLLLVFRAAAKIPFRGGKFIKPLSMLVFFMIVMQTLLGPGENYIVTPLFPPAFPLLGGMGSLKWEGFILGMVIICRLAALMLLLPLLTGTISPHRIALGLTCLGLNYRAAFVITAAFNLIPVFTEDGRTIIDAQKLRGMRTFEEGSVFAKLKAYPGLVVPLVLGAMRKAQAAGTIMDSRAFGVYKTRTWLEKPSMKIHDFLMLAVCFIFAALSVWFNYLLK
ncbi:MAG: energy-coupling factor transporter transmembrane protein EcfT [Treponema sp.]|jgi:energy-coupling factor transport system permease protein|nr:energy-coupling factor transporter transmembrane protein EcfT [Treponema sp.]